MRLSILKSTAAKPLHIEFPDEQPSDLYPKNIKAQPEFGSVLLTLDHLLTQNASRFHVHQKCVYSTETAAEALVSLIGTYYPKAQGLGPQMVDPSTMEAVNELKKDPDNTVALYMVPREVSDRFGGPIVQVVASLIALQNLVAAPAWGDGSALLGMNALVVNVTEMALQASNRLGFVPSLMVMKLVDDLPMNVQQQAAE